MSRLERTLVGIGIGAACPLLSFVTFWWATAAFHLHVMPVPTGLIVAAACIGLGIGLSLDMLYLRWWVNRFFTANWWWMAAIYLFLCVVAVGLFMGVPVETFTLGIAAGAYVGRRAHHRHADERQLAAALRRVAVFAAIVTAGAALPIGLLALQSERQVLRWLENTLPISTNSLQGAGGLVMIGVLCLLLFVTQFWSAMMAGRIAFKITPRHSRTGATSALA